MALNPQDKSSGAKITPPAEGTIPARVARIIEIGEHATKFKAKDQVQIWFSLPTRLIADEGDYQGKQHMVRTQRMTKSSNEKAALMDYVRVLNKDATSLADLLDKPCYLTVVHNEVDGAKGKATYANIMGVMSVPEGMTVGALDTEPFYFDFDNPSAVVWEKNLWDGIREVIKSANNYKGSAVERMVLGLEAGK
jgi:hypothetical protein